MYVCEYSAAQDTFHVDEMTACVWANRRSLLRGHAPEFSIVGVFDRREDAVTFCKTWREEMEKSRPQ